MKRNSNFDFVGFNFGYQIKEGYTLTKKEYQEIVPYEDVENEEDENIAYQFNVKAIESPHDFDNCVVNVVFEDIGVQSVIIFNKENMEIFNKQIVGTTFLYVTYTEERYTNNTCYRGKFLENRLIKKLKTPKQQAHDFVLETVQYLRNRIQGKKCNIELWKPCSVDGYETNINKTGIINSVRTQEEYGVIYLHLIFEDGDEIDTSIDNDMNFCEKDNSFYLEWAGATATDRLSISILAEEKEKCKLKLMLQRLLPISSIILCKLVLQTVLLQFGICCLT